MGGWVVVNLHQGVIFRCKQISLSQRVFKPINADYSSGVVALRVRQRFCTRFLSVYTVRTFCRCKADETDLMCEAFNYWRDLATILGYHIFYWRWRMRREVENQWDEPKQWQTFLEKKAYFFADDLMVKLLRSNTVFVLNLISNTVIGVLSPVLALLWLI